MEKVLSDKEQIVLDKLTMLFVIDKMEIPLTEDSILDICSVKNVWIKNYMDCKAIIHDLVDGKLLYTIGNEQDGKELFILCALCLPDGHDHSVHTVCHPVHDQCRSRSCGGPHFGME